MTTLHIDRHVPAPTQGAQALPTGLAWDGSHFWLADAGSARLFKLEPDGETVADVLLCPGRLGGTAWDGAALWQAIHVDGEVRRLAPASHDIDAAYALGRGWLSGLAWDGALLWVAAQQEGALLGLEPESGALVRELPGAVGAGGLTAHDGALWLAFPEEMRFDPSTETFAWEGSEGRFALARIDPMKGKETERVALPFLPLGLAWKGQELWLTDSRRGRLAIARLV